MVKDFVTRGRTGKEKAVNFGQYAKSYGWGGKWSAEDDSQSVHLFASRGENESIDIYWHERGVFISATYSLAGEKIRLHNVAAAAQVARNKPDEKRLNKAIRRRRKSKSVDVTQISDDVIAGLQTSLPFDKESTDDEVKAVLFNKSITWVNRQTGQVNSAIVGGKSFKVVRNGRDYIDFVDGFGFHAVYLDSIVSVG